MTIEPMLTEEMPANALVARVLQEEVETFAIVAEERHEFGDASEASVRDSSRAPVSVKCTSLQQPSPPVA